MYHPDDLRPGDVLLMVGRPRLTLGGLLDAAIEWATVSPFDHACIVGDGHLIEALWHVQRSPLDKYAANGWRFSVNATPEQKAAAVAWMEHRIGWMYGIRELMRDGERINAEVEPIPSDAAEYTALIEADIAAMKARRAANDGKPTRNMGSALRGAAAQVAAASRAPRFPTPPRDAGPVVDYDDETGVPRRRWTLHTR